MTCVWDFDLHRTNLLFLDGIDPLYFEHVALHNEPLLDGDEKQYAATTLRASYTHALETFFALLTGALKAPNGIAGWMVRYNNSDLEGLVRSIHEPKAMFEFGERLHPEWKSAASLIIGPVWDDEEATINHFARLWSRFAREYIDPKQQTEYNSFKHGLRMQMGGHSVAIGFEDAPGVLAPNERMRSLGGSEFGSTFYETEDFDKHNIRVKSHSVNWNPIKYAIALRLLAYSINNVLSYLKAMNGTNPAEVQFFRPDNPEVYDAVWNYEPRMSFTGFNAIITAKMIQPFTKEEIIEAFEKSLKEDEEGEVLPAEANAEN